MIQYFKTDVGDFSIETKHGVVTGITNRDVALKALQSVRELAVEPQQPAPNAPTSKIPDEVIIPFFGLGPCWFEGCEELRADYRKEKDKLAKASKSGQCSDCDLGALQAKYSLRVRNALENVK